MIIALPPPPNLIVRNRTSNKAHLFYAIVPVCTSDQARSKPIQYLKAIYHALALRLEADLSYSGPVAKTPFHPWWQTTELHRGVYELNELADSLELETRGHGFVKIFMSLIPETVLYSNIPIDTHMTSSTKKEKRAAIRTLNAVWRVSLIAKIPTPRISRL